MQTAGFEEQQQRILEYMKLGMNQHGKQRWPVMMDYSDKPCIIYPQDTFSAIQVEHQLYLAKDTIKLNRVKLLKNLLDMLANKAIHIHYFHLGLHILYDYPDSYKEREDREKIGSKRQEFFETLPSYRLEKNDDFINDVIANQDAQNMFEGFINLGHQGGTLIRHYVGHIPLHVGNYIEVKKDEQWIPGRYEWSFKEGDPIKISAFKPHRNFEILEGFLVRVFDPKTAQLRATVSSTK
ncbi:hypothetical protein RSX24_029205 [Paenibacillus sp. ES5-4]